MNTKIIGTGSAVPSRVLDNAELSTFLDTSDEWIRTRTGIRSRHIAQEGQTASALAAQAAKKAIADAGIAAEQIEAIIVATSIAGLHISEYGKSCPTGDWGRARGMF